MSWVALSTAAKLHPRTVASQGDSNRLNGAGFPRGSTLLERMGSWDEPAGFRQRSGIGLCGWSLASRSAWATHLRSASAEHQILSAIDLIAAHFDA